jgi:hypothetical protein
MKLYKESGEAYPAVKVLPNEDPAPAGFEEVTDICEFAKLGLNSVDIKMPGWTDRLAFRSELKIRVYAKMQLGAPADVESQTHWDRLTDDEKSLAAHYFLVGRESFLHEVVDDTRYWTIQAGDFRHWTQECRTYRAELAESIIFLRMQDLGHAKLILADLNQIAKDAVIELNELKKLTGKVRVKRLNRMYIEGLEDEEHDGVVAIKDWICSKEGTPFQNNGFKNLAYPFRTGHTADSVADELIAILDGVY